MNVDISLFTQLLQERGEEEEQEEEVTPWTLELVNVCFSLLLVGTF